MSDIDIFEQEEIIERLFLSGEITADEYKVRLAEYEDYYLHKYSKDFS